VFGDDARIRASKFLSRVLRHRPDSIGIELGEGGWVEVDTLLVRCRDRGELLTRAQLLEVVSRCDKQRFALSADGQRIRASQGHSVKIDLGYAVAEPPAELFHGTTRSRLEVIRVEGLRAMRRHHVHLSACAETAARVGRRHGPPIVLRVRADRMVVAGHTFFESANGVWLTEKVPPEFLEWPPED